LLSLLIPALAFSEETLYGLLLVVEVQATMGKLLLRLLIGGGLGLLFLRVTVKSLVMIETLMNLR